MTETQNSTAPVKALLFGLDLGEYDMEKSMEELAALAEAAGMEAVAEVVQKRAAPEAATYLGEGRLAEGRLLCRNLGAQCAIFDAELSGSQIRNLEEFLEVEVLDRTMLILEIFARRAVTSEGKLQTELALLRYRLPRLAGLGQSLSRQGGGGGGGTGARRGAGESKLEYDRRHVRRRIEALSERLAEVSRRREQARRSRQKSGVPVVALVGYTNVGKSSLLNRMCGAGVLEADMLFATLDPTARQLTLRRFGQGGTQALFQRRDAPPHQHDRVQQPHRIAENGIQQKTAQHRPKNQHVPSLVYCTALTRCKICCVGQSRASST